MLKIFSTMLFLTLLAPSAKAAFQIEPESIGFGFVMVGLADKKIVRISNYDNVGHSLELNYVSSIDFLISDNCHAVLWPTAVCDIEITFRPALRGSMYTAIEVLGDNSKQKIDIYGSGYETSRPPSFPF